MVCVIMKKKIFLILSLTIAMSALSAQSRQEPDTIGGHIGENPEVLLRDMPDRYIRNRLEIRLGHGKVPYFPTSSVSTSNKSGTGESAEEMLGLVVPDIREQMLNRISDGIDPIKRMKEYIDRDNIITRRHNIDTYLPSLLSNFGINHLNNQNPASERMTLFVSEKDTISGILQGDTIMFFPVRELRTPGPDTTVSSFPSELFLTMLNGPDSKNVIHIGPVSSKESTSTTGQSTAIGTSGANTSRWALKTNMLLWGILTPNLEVEYLISRKWSINIDGQFAWWSNSSKHDYYQIAAISPELRYWLCSKTPFSGHYIGFFSGTGLYDLEMGKTGYQSDNYLSVGLSYGYMKPLSRRLSLEFGIGAGYVSTQYRKYLPADGHYVYQTTNHRNYTGPVKVKIGLVWKFNNISK